MVKKIEVRCFGLNFAEVIRCTLNTEQTAQIPGHSPAVPRTAYVLVAVCICVKKFVDFLA